MLDFLAVDVVFKIKDGFQSKSFSMSKGAGLPIKNVYVIKVN